MEHDCLKEQDWGRLFEICKSFSKHMEEGDKLGGWRDRLMLAELSIKDTNRVVAEIKAEIKMKIYWASAIGGLVGGLMAVLTKDSLQFILNILMNWIK